MTVCPNCLYENPDDRDFCRECKSYLKWDVPTETELGPVTPAVSDVVDSDAPTVVIGPSTELSPVPVPEPAPGAPRGARAGHAQNQRTADMPAVR